MTDRSSFRSIVALAWPVFIGQIAVMLNSLIDIAMAGRLSATDMAAVGLGSSIFVSIYVGAIGIILALTPVIAQQYGGKDFDAIGRSFAQGVWLALLLSIPAALAMAWSAPWLALSAPPAAVANITSNYLLAVTAGLPAALLFRTFYAFSNAVSLPKAIMFINLLGLALKVPMNSIFMNEFGGAGCGVATAVIAWLQIAVAAAWLRRPEYRRFRLFQDWRQRWRPRLHEQARLLKLGLPIGAAYLIEVTSFTFMAIFVARLGEQVAASHQIAANLAGLAYMTALALSNASAVLVAQAIGAQQQRQIGRIVKRGALLVAAAALLTGLVLLIANQWLARFYTSDPLVQQAAVPLLLILAGFHLFDAGQTYCAFVLRSFKITLLPSVIYVVALWGIGLGGGWYLTLASLPASAQWLRNALPGAGGFWAAALFSLMLAFLLLMSLLLLTLRRQRLIALQA